MAAVRVVLPWSMWPIVPTLMCGLFLTNFSFAIPDPPLSPPAPSGDGRATRGGSPASRRSLGVRTPSAPVVKTLQRRPRSRCPGAARLLHDRFLDRSRCFLVVGELHGMGGAPLGHGAQGSRVPEHRTKGYLGLHHLTPMPI